MKKVTTLNEAARLARLRGIFKHGRGTVREFVAIARASGYRVSSTWDKRNQCPTLERTH